VTPLVASLEYGAGPLNREVSSLGIPVFSLRRGRARNVWLSGQRIRDLARIIAHNRIHAVICNGGHPLLFGRPAAWLAGVPCVWRVVAFNPHDALQGEYAALFQQMMGADALFANSQFTARLLTATFSERTRICVVPQPVDTEEFRPDAAAGLATRGGLGIPAQEIVVGMFGRVQRWKGQHVFVEAARELLARGFSGWFLVAGGPLFGLEEEYYRQLEAYIREHRLGHRVHLLGHRADVNQLLNACDIVVHASVEPEPWGRTVAEAMAAGKPAIASDLGGPREMIRHGENGRLVPPGHPASLAQEIERLAADGEQRSRLGGAARAHAVAAFAAGPAAGVFCEELEAACLAFQRT
jgi:glycosyltransferase involved in cell wall biosynthesis